MTPIESNNIPSKQLQPELICLLRARYRSYASAKLVQGVFVILTVLLPAASLIFSSDYPGAKPYLTFLTIVLLLLDVGLFERANKEKCKQGAKLQEEFDVEVMELPWNRFIVGAKVDHEDVCRSSTKPLSKKREGALIAWYEPCVGELPIHFGRLVCQRTNIAYDAKMRRKYSNTLLWFAVLLGVGLSVLGIAMDMRLADLLSTVWMPLSPVLTWTLREYRKHADTADKLTGLKSEWEKLWEKALKGATANEITVSSRELQDAIFQHRASSPLVFDWVYSFMRSDREAEANHAATKLVETAKKALVKKEAA